jgi:hypothetical protein
LSLMICSICSTLNINIKGIKNPPIRWFYSFAVSSTPQVLYPYSPQYLTLLLLSVAIPLYLISLHTII